MPEFVYALHNFEPEHDDEIAFRAGERIEVVEKDDLYGDGWWQGRNLAGKVGLFPQSYTAAASSSPESTHAAPSALSDAATSSVHQTSNTTTATVIIDTANLKSADAVYQDDTTVIAPVPHAPLDFASLANGHPNGTGSAADDGGLSRSTDQAASPNPANATQTDADGDGDGEVMRATMTDVQQAIEQLGGGDRGRAEDGDTRSFSFASSHDERDTDRETDTDLDAFDLSDVEGREGGGANAEGAGEGWHKGARRKLAEKARRAVEEAEKLEAMMGSMGNSAGDRARERGGSRMVAPPIDVELSDESDVEENDFVTRSGPRTHPFIPEEDEEEEGPAADAEARVQEERFIKRGSSSSVQSVNLIIPERDEYEVKTATVTKSTFAVQPPPEVPLVENEYSIRTIQPLPNASTSVASSLSPPSPPSETLSNPFASPPGMFVSPSITATGTTTTTSPEMPRAGTPMRESLAALPSPTTSFAGSVPGGQVQSRHDSRASASPARESDFGGGGAGARGSGSVAGQASSQQNTLVEDRREGEKEKAHPSEWTVEDVVEWLRGKGFDQDVCSKFIEQEITGDVLLELDANLLKSEIGITAFGKRVRIANAITELRRPPSVAYSDHQHSHTHQQQQYPGFSPEQLSPASPIMLQAQAQVQTAARSSSPHPALAHSRTQSLAQSHHSYPGASIGTGASVSASTGTGTAPSTGVSSFGSPFAYAQAQGPPPPGQGYLPGAYGQAGYAQMNGVTVLATGPIVLESSSQEHYGSAAVGAAAGATVGEMPQTGHLGGIGLGIGMPPVNGKGIKLRPAHLSLSPSDGALKASANKSVARAQAEGETDRGHFSDGEAAPMSMRQRLFGRSHESTSTKTESPATSRHSKEDEVSPSIPTPPTSRDDDKDKDKDSSSVATSRHARSKKSVDGGSKGGERLSIFGASFGGSLGKHRKPPPRYSGIGEDVASEKSSSMFTLPRLHGPSNRKSSSGRPSSSHGSSSGAAGALAALRPSTAREREQHKVDKQKVSAPLAVVKEKEPRDVAVLRKRTSSAPGPVPTPSLRTPSSDSVMTNGNGSVSVSVNAGGVSGPLKQGESILDQIGEPDHSGWMRKKGDRYNSWKLRYFVLKGPHLYYLKSSSRSETKIKGYINIVGYKVTVDENSNPGRYAFRIEHDNDKTHFFSSDEKIVLREWMKAIMKATIGRDYTKPVISSCNIPTIPLTVAQAMNPAPRPPSPSARDATQKALRRENPNQLSSRDARILMGLPSNADGQEERTRLDSFFANESVDGAQQPKSAVPPRPSRELRRISTSKNNYVPVEEGLIEWANSHLPHQLRITDSTSSLYSGLGLLRIAESIRGFPSSPPVPDSDFPSHPNDDKLDGLFKLFDFLLDNDVKMGSVSINDIRQGKRDKVIQLLRALKSWEDKRRAIAHSFGATSVHAGSFVAPNIW